MSIDNEIRKLDPARDVSDDLGWSPSADALLAQLHQTPAAGVDAAAPRSDHAHRKIGSRSAVRWLAPVAAVSAGVFALTTLPGGQDAYASWTAYPTGTSVAPDSAGGTWCTEWWATNPTARGAEVRPVLTEVRGDHTLVVGHGDGGVNALCLARTDDTGPEVSGGTQVWTAPDLLKAADTIALTAYDTTSHGDRDPSPDDVEPAFSAITGEVGPDVVSVVVNTPQQGPVQVSVVNGTFAAWWPWEIEWGQPAYPALTFDLELSDGTEIKSVPLEQVDQRSSD